MALLTEPNRLIMMVAVMRGRRGRTTVRDKDTETGIRESCMNDSMYTVFVSNLILNYTFFASSLVEGGRWKKQRQ